MKPNDLMLVHRGTLMKTLEEGGRLFLQGGIACSEGAIAAGCRFYAGYPITPASEIAERMAERLPTLGGTFLQMEDEIASICSIIGASWGGVKSMTATSGPGFSLMQESIGYACMTETPILVVDVQRAGPSTGQATKCATGDLMQARWGTHGDHEVVALSPNSVQEMFDLTVRAFNLSEQYRVPVILLADEIVAHMRETVDVPPFERIELTSRRRASRRDEPPFGGVGDEGVPPMPPLGEGYHIMVTGSTHDEWGLRSTGDPEIHRKLVSRLVNKIRRHAEEITDNEEQNIEDCRVGVVSYGCVSRSVYEAMRRHPELRIGHLRLKTIWPFPEKAIRALAERVKTIVIPEMNLKQIYFEVQRASGRESDLAPINKIGGGLIITPEEIASKVKEVSS